MLYPVLMKLIQKGSTEGLAKKIDVFFAAGKITEEQYTTLTTLLKKGSVTNGEHSKGTGAAVWKPSKNGTVRNGVILRGMSLPLLLDCCWVSFFGKSELCKVRT